MNTLRLDSGRIIALNEDKMRPPRLRTLATCILAPERGGCDALRCFPPASADSASRAKHGTTPRDKGATLALRGGISRPSCVSIVRWLRGDAPWLTLEA